MEDLNKYLDNIGEKRDTLRHYLLKTHAECKFTDQELDNALDLATRRGVRLHAKTIVHKINLSNK